jgi:hypothetical protein
MLLHSNHRRHRVVIVVAPEQCALRLLLQCHYHLVLFYTHSYTINIVTIYYNDFVCQFTFLSLSRTIYKAREFVSRVQQLRKTAGLAAEDLISVFAAVVAADGAIVDGTYGGLQFNSHDLRRVSSARITPSHSLFVSHSLFLFC